MMKKSLLLLFLLVTFGVNTMRAGGFQDYGNSARAVGLGGAHIALHGDPYVIFYNPALLSQVNRLSLSTYYANLMPGIEDDNLNYMSVSAGIPIDILGSIGAGFSFFNTKLWKEYSFVGSYSHDLFAGITVGANVRFLGWSAEAAPGESALSYTGLAFDAGALYTLNNIAEETDFSVGLSLRNLNKPSIAKSGSSDAALPLIIGLGTSVVSRKYGYLFAVDVLKEDDIVTLLAGTEFKLYSDTIFDQQTDLYFRFGYNKVIDADFTKASAIAGGFGLYTYGVKLDYAYEYPWEIKGLNGNHKISLAYRF